MTAIEFQGNDYLKFISHCFSNVLISGVRVKFKGELPSKTILFVTVAAPGIARLDAAVEKFGGKYL